MPVANKSVRESVGCPKVWRVDFQCQDAGLALCLQKAESPMRTASLAPRARSCASHAWYLPAGIAPDLANFELLGLRCLVLEQRFRRPASI